MLRNPCLPKEALSHLNVDTGDEIYLVETDDGYIVTQYDPEFEEQMEAMGALPPNLFEYTQNPGLFDLAAAFTFLSLAAGNLSEEQLSAWFRFDIRHQVGVFVYRHDKYLLVGIVDCIGMANII